MKKALLFLLVSAALLAGCRIMVEVVYCSDETATVTSSKSGFTRVSIDNACEATITKGESWSIEIEISEDAEEHLKVVSSDSELRLSLNVCANPGAATRYRHRTALKRIRTRIFSSCP